MPKEYFANYNLDALTLRLRSIIQVDREDSLSNHFKQIILFKDENKVSGIIKDNGFKIWTHEQGRSGATGAFYTILEAQVNPWNKGLRVELKSKMNVIGKIILTIMYSYAVYGIITGIIIQENNELRFIILRSIIGFVLFGLLISLPIFIYFTNSNVLKQHIIKELDLINKPM